MDEAFETLRRAPLHAMAAAEWEAWFPAMAAWLDHADPDRRAAALERLMMGAFGCPAPGPEGPLPRAAWLLRQVEQAAARHPDLLRGFLMGLRWHGDDAPFPGLLLPWLHALAERDAALAPLVQGAIILVGGLATEDGQWPALLDHPSDHVRACAACRLGRQGFGDSRGDGRQDPAIIAALTRKELARPGIAGPFWSGCGYFGDDPGFDALAWMLEIVERRHGPEPADLPFNGIDFHIHELAADNPAAVRRLLAAGRADLAAMAATDLPGPVPGMAPVLRDLALLADPAIARAAQDHLARYYAERPPGAAPGRQRHLPGWRAGIDAVLIRHGEAPTRWLLVLRPAGAAPLSDAQAWDAIDAALPPALRGPPVPHVLAGPDAAPGPWRLGSQEFHDYASGAQVMLEGDPAAGRWTRLEIGAGRLGDRWHPLGGPDAAA